MFKFLFGDENIINYPFERENLSRNVTFQGSRPISSSVRLYQCRWIETQRAPVMLLGSCKVPIACFIGEHVHNTLSCCNLPFWKLSFIVCICPLSVTSTTTTTMKGEEISYCGVGHKKKEKKRKKQRSPSKREHIGHPAAQTRKKQGKKFETQLSRSFHSRADIAHCAVLKV